MRPTIIMEPLLVRHSAQKVIFSFFFFCCFFIRNIIALQAGKAAYHHDLSRKLEQSEHLSTSRSRLKVPQQTRANRIHEGRCAMYM